MCLLLVGDMGGGRTERPGSLSAELGPAFISARGSCLILKSSDACFENLRAPMRFIGSSAILLQTHLGWAKDMCLSVSDVAGTQGDGGTAKAH